MNFKARYNRLSAKIRGSKRAEKRSRRFEQLFDREWEVFVIKKDESGAQLIGKTDCCALSPV